jgi:SAM-dependent methyltransferase
MSETDERKRSIAAMFERNILRDAQSPVFREYCRRVHGVDRFQYNSLEARHFELLLDALALSRGDAFLDLGCAAGTITVEVARRTGARGVGLDFAAGVIDFASRTTSSELEVSFQKGDIDGLGLPTESFDAIVAIDTLYFARDLQKTARDLVALLKPGGRLVAAFSAFQGPEQPPEVLAPHGTALASALRACGATFTCVDLTADDREHWKRAVAVTEQLKAAWESADERDAWEALCEEQNEIVPLVEAKRSARFLYTARRA